MKTVWGQEVRIVLLMPNMNSEVKYWERAGRVVPDARILVKHIASPADGSYGYAVLSDTVYTKENGEYLYQNTITGYQDFRIICEDLTGVYQTDSVDIKMNPKGGNGRYEGKDNREVVFKLKKRVI
jgi:hypothetical protein